MSKKKKRDRKREGGLIPASWQKLKSERELRNIEKVKVFYTFKIWKNNLMEESRENVGGGVGELPT